MMPPKLWPIAPTPGEWRTGPEQHTHGENTCISNEQGYAIAIVQSHAWKIIDRKPGEKARGKDVAEDVAEDVANLHLMANAKWMAVLLKELVDYAQDVASQLDERPGCIDRARALSERLGPCDG